MRVVEGVGTVLTDSFSRRMLVDVLHGSDRVAQEAVPQSWSLDGDLGNDPKTTGALRFVHHSIKGESWVPEGPRGILSPFRATLLMTEEISAGPFVRRVQLGLFDVVSVPEARDYTAHVAGAERVIASEVSVTVASLDKRVLDASFRSPVTASGNAWDLWRRYGILPVQQDTATALLPRTSWPAEQGSRLDAVQHCARALGGVPVVDSFGQWRRIGEEAPIIELHAGESGTVVETGSDLDLDGFYNVIIGDYEDEEGRPIRAEWIAPGELSPSAVGREFVRYHSSDQVRTQAAANAAVASVGRLATTREVDVVVECVYNPLVELGDRVRVGGQIGVAQKVSVSSEARMRVTVRVRRPF